MILAALAFVLAGNTAAADPAAAEGALWKQLAKGQAIVLMRHALAPGTGDPATFDINDCDTQRNLSEEGLRQAKRIGREFRNRGIENIPVFSSAWCRCLDTAVQLDLGKVEVLPSLNSFFRAREKEPLQTSQTRTFIKDRLKQERGAVLVTHQVNITALTNIFPRSGEAVFIALEGGETSVLGSIEFPIEQ